MKRGNVTDKHGNEPKLDNIALFDEEIPDVEDEPEIAVVGEQTLEQGLAQRLRAAEEAGEVIELSSDDEDDAPPKQSSGGLFGSDSDEPVYSPSSPAYSPSNHSLIFSESDEDEDGPSYHQHVFSVTCQNCGFNWDGNAQHMCDVPEYQICIDGHDRDNGFKKSLVKDAIQKVLDEEICFPL